MKTITEMVNEHKQKLQAIRDQNGSTAELVDQMLVNNAELIAALEGDKKTLAARPEHVVGIELSEMVDSILSRKRVSVEGR